MGLKIKTKMMSILKRIICAILIPFKMVFYRFCPRKVSTSPENQQRYQNIKESSHVVDFDWQTDWDVKAKSQTECKIEEYRNSRMMAKKETSPALGTGDPDFFSDMAPTSVRQAKVFVGTERSETSLERVNRLSVSYEEQIQSDPSLKDWGAIDEPETGWDPDDEDISDVLKEHKKNEKIKCQKLIF